MRENSQSVPALPQGFPRSSPANVDPPKQGDDAWSNRSTAGSDGADAESRSDESLSCASEGCTSQDLEGFGDVLQSRVHLQQLTPSPGINFSQGRTTLAIHRAPLAGNSSCPADSPSETRRRRNRRKQTKSVLGNTPMCRFYAQSHCNKAACCSFAHGQGPLQVRQDGHSATIVDRVGRIDVCGNGQAKWHWPCPPGSSLLGVPLAMPMEKCMQEVPTECLIASTNQTFQAPSGRQAMLPEGPAAASGHDTIGTMDLPVKKTFIHFDVPKWVRAQCRSSSADARFAYDH